MTGKGVGAVALVCARVGGLCGGVGEGGAAGKVDVDVGLVTEEVQDDVGRVRTGGEYLGDSDLRRRAVVAALRAAARAEMAVRAVVLDILCLAVDAVRRVGDLRQVVAAERHVHAEAHDRIRHLCRDGGNKRTVGIDA